MDVFYWIGFSWVCWLMADFLSGVFHWWEDRYADERWPFVGKFIAIPNQIHHQKPMEFLAGSYWARNWTTLVPAAIAFAVTFPSKWSLVFVFASQANEVHAWAHSKGKASRWVEALQETGLIQSPKKHARHHTAPFATSYCVMSDMLNPFLDQFHIWKAIEWLVEKVFKARPKAT